MILTASPLTNLTPIVEAVIALLAALVSAFVIPWVKRKASAEDLQQLQAWVQIAVAAAEQLYNQTDGGKKKEYVMEYLQSKGYKIDSTLINTIEAEVLKLHNELYGG